MSAPAHKSPGWSGPAAASVSKRVTGAAAATSTATAGGGVTLLPPPSPAPHDDDTCPDCGAGLCAELVSCDPGTGETLYEARDYCAACTGAPERALPGRDDYDFGPTEIGEDWPCW